MKSKLVLAALAVALVTAVTASAGGTPNLKTFGTGDVFVNGNKGATFNDAGEYGGFYRTATSNRLLSDSHIDLEFVNDRAVGGGAPRFSIPIDENHDNKAEAYAFMDVNGCGSPTVSTESATCQVFYKSEVQPNWNAFAAAHPTWRIARKDVIGVGREGGPVYGATQPFIIADVTGDYLVHGIVLGY